jgi:N-acetylneuraminic acid mutarotase
VLILGGQARATNQGFPDGTPLASAEIFDPASGTWSAAKPMPRPRSGHIATPLSNGLVLVAGGDKLQADLYNPATDSWTSAGTVPMPMSRPTQTAAALADGRILIAPGFTTDGMPFGPTPLYDPKTNSWTTVAPMTWGKTEAVGSALLPNGDVLVVGESAAGTAGATAEIFTPSSKSWSAVLSDTQDTRFNFWTVLALPSGKGLAFAGPSPTVPGTPAGKLYDPKTHAWSVSRPLAHPRGGGFTATLLPNGKVLVTGGMDPDPVAQPTSAAEQYSP